MADCTVWNWIRKLGMIGKGLGVGASRAARPLQQMKVPLCLRDIFPNLLTQGFDRRKLDFVPQAFEKADLDFGLGRQFEWMEIEQVGLDREQLRPKRRSIANIRDRIKSFRPNASPCNVDAILRNQFFVARQVDRGYRVFRSISAPAARSTQECRMAAPAGAEPGSPVPR